MVARSAACTWLFSPSLNIGAWHNVEDRVPWLSLEIG